ncbi:toll/interleukin-1 receptor domain-containing protein [Chitinimonas sp.]|uniref:toll/interleukin-1 receptor domain-containing protein n=1 Tax=Chitinimonas sp. TaxID=1934313 RepID=UPI002F95B8F3
MWDVFISHASEDKDLFVRPLAESLAFYGLSIWYDEFSLHVGDSLCRSIDKGLAKSNYGVVVLSPSFLRKDWPEYELKGLTAKEFEGRKVILPIWFNVSKADLLAYSPTLADKFAINADRKDIAAIALELIKVIRPDVFTSIHRKLRWEEQLKSAKMVDVELGKIKHSPIIHEELAPSLIGRIRLVRAALWGAHTHSMDAWVDGFKRDLHPENEVEWWEHIAACHLEFIKSRKLSRKQIDVVFPILFWLGNSVEPDDLRQYVPLLGTKNFDLLVQLPRYRYPILDVEEKFPEEGNRLPDEAYGKIRVAMIDDVPMRPDIEG